MGLSHILVFINNTKDELRYLCMSGRTHISCLAMCQTACMHRMKKALGVSCYTDVKGVTWYGVGLWTRSQPHKHKVSAFPSSSKQNLDLLFLEDLKPGVEQNVGISMD